MKKKKILMLHNYYQIGGGEDTVYKNELDLLRKNGHEVIEYTRHNSEIQGSVIKKLLLPLTTIWSWKTFFEVRKIISKEKIDIVHCHNTFPLISPSVYYAAMSRRVKVVQTVHNFRLLCPNGSFFCNGEICEKCNTVGNFKNAIRNKCYRNSAIQTMVVIAMLKMHRFIGTYHRIGYIFLTDFNKDKFSKLININGSNVFIKPNFVERTDSIQKYLDIDPKSFLVVGELEKENGIIDLVERWEALPKEYHLHIFGEGTYYELLKEKTKVIHNIHMWRFKSQTELRIAMASVKAVIIPSKGFEMYRRNILESFSVATPVIVNDTEHQAEMIKVSEGGIVCQLNNVKSLEVALRKVISNNVKLSENAYNYYLSSLLSSDHYDQMINIYRGGRFVFVGRLESNKGICKLLDLWKKLPSNYRLDVYGVGSYEDFIRETADKYENINYYGYKKKTDIQKAFLNAEASIIPSEWYEAFGMSIPECFVLGTPVISSNMGNPKEMIMQSGGGEVFNVGNYDSLKKALDNILLKRSLYSRNAYHYWNSHLSDSKNYELLNNIYNTL